MKNNININRIGLLLKQQAYSCKSNLLHLLSGYIIGYLIFIVLASISYWSSNHPVNASTYPSFGKALSVIYFCYITLAYSMTFCNLETPQKRTSFLMIPANTIEKYLTRIIQTTIVGVIGGILVLCVADAIHMLLELVIFQQGTHSCLPQFFNAIPNYLAVTIHSEDSSYNISGFGICAITYFILCSSAFRTKAFIKGIGLYCLFTTVILLLIALCASLFRNEISVECEDDENIVSVAVVIISILMWALSAMNIWLSYINFKKISIV